MKHKKEKILSTNNPKFIFVHILSYYNFLNPHLEMFFLIGEREREGTRGGGERERERERNDVKGKHHSVVSNMSPDWGSNPQPKCVA